jgi:hypothetical protein
MKTTKKILVTLSAEVTLDAYACVVIEVPDDADAEEIEDRVKDVRSEIGRIAEWADDEGRRVYPYPYLDEPVWLVGLDEANRTCKAECTMKRDEDGVLIVDFGV